MTQVQSGRRLIVHRDEVPKQGMDNPRDQCWYWELISGDVQGSTDIQFGVGRMEPGERHLLHHHPHAAEFYYVLAGSGRFTVGDQEVQAGPGTAMYMPRDTRHAIWNNTAEPLEFVYGFDAPNFSDCGNVYDE